MSQDANGFSESLGILIRLYLHTLSLACSWYLQDTSVRVVVAAPPDKNFLKNQKIPMLNGEVPVFKVANVVHLTNFTNEEPASITNGVVGYITLTNYRLSFCALQTVQVYPSHHWNLHIIWSPWFNWYTNFVVRCGYPCRINCEVRKKGEQKWTLWRPHRILPWHPVQGQ